MGNSNKNKRRDRDRKRKKEKSTKRKPEPESEPEDEADGVDLFKVEKIVDSKTDKKGQTLYRVRWVGYGPADDTWEPIENVASTGHADRWIRECRARNLSKRVPGVALIEYEDGEQQLVDLKREKFRSYIEGNESDRDDDSRDGDPDVNDFALIREGAVIELLWPKVNIYFEARIVSWTPLEGVVYRDAKKKGQEKQRKAVKAAVCYGESAEDASPEKPRKGAKSRRSVKSMVEDPSFDVSSEEEEEELVVEKQPKRDVRRSRRSKAKDPIFDSSDDESPGKKVQASAGKKDKEKEEELVVTKQPKQDVIRSLRSKAKDPIFDSSDNESPEKKVQADAGKKANTPFFDSSDNESPEKKVQDPAVNASENKANATTKPKIDVKRSSRSSRRNSSMLDDSDDDLDVKPKAKESDRRKGNELHTSEKIKEEKAVSVATKDDAKKPTKRSRDESDDSQKNIREETQQPSKKRSKKEQGATNYAQASLKESSIISSTQQCRPEPSEAQKLSIKKKKQKGTKKSTKDDASTEGSSVSLAEQSQQEVVKETEALEEQIRKRLSRGSDVSSVEPAPPVRKGVLRGSYVSGVERADDMKMSKMEHADVASHSAQGALKSSNDNVVEGTADANVLSITPPKVSSHNDQQDLTMKTPKTSNFSSALRSDVDAKLPTIKPPDSSSHEQSMAAAKFSKASVQINIPIPKKPRPRPPSPPPVPVESKSEVQRRGKRDKKSSSKLKVSRDDIEQKVGSRKRLQKMNRSNGMESDSSSSLQREDKKKKSDAANSIESSSLGKVSGLDETSKKPQKQHYSLDTDEYLKNIESSDEGSIVSSDVDDSLYKPPERVGYGVPLFNEPEDEFGSDDDDEYESNSSYEADESIAQTPNDLNFEQLWMMRLDQVRETIFGTR